MQNSHIFLIKLLNKKSYMYVYSCTGFNNVYDQTKKDDAITDTVSSIYIIFVLLTLLLQLLPQELSHLQHLHQQLNLSQ